MSAAAVRRSGQAMLALARQGRLLHLTLDEGALDACVDLVIATTRASYPDGRIPFHARWRHFTVAGRDLWQECASSRRWEDATARLRAAWDLAIVSVLLDAGAGPDWRFREPLSGLPAGRSEGLGLASLAMFRDGAFSATPDDPLRVDAAALAGLTAEALARGFQVTETNPLVGLEGRAAVLRRLGESLRAAGGDSARPGDMLDRTLARQRTDGSISAPAVLADVLRLLSPVWPVRPGAVPDAGDVWVYRDGSGAEHAVAFHKLSQWLTYSLLEPLIEAGMPVTDVDGLTGLPEYRNGGLFLDTGVLALRDPAAATRAHEVGAGLVVEWRALTVALLDEVALRMRRGLGLSAADLPLARVLEGGTWAAGRRIARERREGGGPPLAVISDGTVF